MSKTFFQGGENNFRGGFALHEPPLVTGLHMRDHSTTMICSVQNCNWLAVTLVITYSETDSV